MKPDVEGFFLDPVDVLNKAFKKFVQVLFICLVVFRPVSFVDLKL